MTFFLLFLGMALGSVGSTGSTGQAANQNIVRICSVAVSPSNCQDLDARLLEPVASGSIASGQRAFIDPLTGTLVQPTEEQLEELTFAVSIDESMAKRGTLKVEKLPDGTLKLGPGASFAVNSEAVIERKEKP